MASLSLSGIKKSFGSVRVLHGIDLEIEDGEFVVLVGPSGCGKSTLLRLLAGLETITEGEFRMNGTLMNDVAPAERGIGMVFQSYALYPHMTVAQNISFGLRLRGTARAEIEARVRETSASLHIDGLLDRKPKDLSGGQRQRVAIGRALIQQPDVFLFDEPLSNLDAKLRISMRVEIARLHRKLRSTSVYVTHDQVEALTLADKIVILNNGRVEQIGKPLDLYHRPATEFVAGFIGSPQMNMLRGRLVEATDRLAIVTLDVGGTVTIAADARTALPDDVVTVGVRPESFAVGPAENELMGRIEVAEQLGEVSYLHISIAALETPLVVKVDGASTQSEGENISFGFAQDSAHLFNHNGVAFTRTVDHQGQEPKSGLKF